MLATPHSRGNAQSSSRRVGPRGQTVDSQGKRGFKLQVPSMRVSAAIPCNVSEHSPHTRAKHIKVSNLFNSVSGIVLLRNDLGDPIIRTFKNALTSEATRVLKSWLEREELVWGPARNPLRLTAWTTDFPCLCTYTYAEQEWATTRWDDTIKKYAVEVAKFIGHDQNHFNSAVLNKYTTGRAAVGAHADDEDIFGKPQADKCIASVSVGAPRIFRIENVRTREYVDHTTENAEILTMERNMQDTRTHAILTSTDNSVRYNITFRRIVEHCAHCPCRRVGRTPSRTSSFSGRPVD